MVTTLCCALDAVALTLGVALAWRSPSVGVRRELLLWIAFGGIVGFAAILLLRSTGGFAVLRGLTHALFCVLLPVIAVRAVCVGRRQPWLAASGLMAFVVGEACFLWAREVEPFRLEVTTHTVTSERLAGLARPLRVAVVADLQTDRVGAPEAACFDRLVELRPDLVLFAGDYLQLDAAGIARELPALHAQLARLAPPLGMFAVTGDVDAPGGGAAGVLRGTAVRAIDDEVVSLAGAPIDVIGLGRARSRMASADIGLVRRLAGERFPIVLGHAPDFMRSVLTGGLDPDALLVAGHTHGGQIQVPGFGPLLTLSSVPRWLAGGGVFRRGRAWLAVSRGVGMERDDAPRIRFWCRPQILVIELRGPVDV